MMSACLLLAFGFASPLFLGGLALGAIPILIHLFYRRPHRETSWAAMRFLLAATQRMSQRVRFEQLILLAVRTLILLLLVLAFARPQIESLAFPFRGPSPVHRVIVIDASYSMGQRRGDSTAFGRAKEQAQKIAEGAKQGDAFNLVRLSQSPPHAIIREPSYSKDSVLGEIDRLEVSDEPGYLAAAVPLVSQMVESGQGPSRKEIYFLSDFQRSCWSDVIAGENSEVQDAFEKLAQQAQVLLIGATEATVPNRAITSFDMNDPLARVRQPVHLKITVRGFGVDSLEGQMVQLYVDGRLAQTFKVEAAAGPKGDSRRDEAHIDFTQEFTTGGSHILEARLAGDDALPIDDSRWLVVDVRDELRVLLVDGGSSTNSGRSTDYLRLALSPDAKNSGQSGILVTRTINDGELPTVNLNQYDCVFLCNVARFTPRELDMMSGYVKGGGGLIFCLGDRVDLDHYNRLLFEERGLLPARLDQVVGRGEPSENYFYLDPNDLRHPIVAPFDGNPGTGLEEVLTFAYVRASRPDDSKSEIALKFNTGDPAIIDATIGDGRSILLTTWIDDNWSTWAYSRSFPPLVNEMVLRAVSRQHERRQLLVGEPLNWPLPASAFRAAVFVELPDGEQVPVTPEESGEHLEVSYGPTSQRGIYRLKVGDPANHWEAFAVNVDTRESDLAEFSEADLRAAMPAGVDFAILTELRQLPSAVESANPDSGELTRWLLVAAFCLLVVEQVMAWKFVYGLWTLYAAIAIVLSSQVLKRDVSLGLILMGVLAAGFLAMFAYQRGRLASRFGPARG